MFQGLHVEDDVISQFEEHAEKVCQISELAAASSTDPRGKFNTRWFGRESN